ncbi:MAG: hypothetical protein V3W34_08690 [Phycisphaerae bacterium]
MNIKKSLSLIVALAFAFSASAYACPPNCQKALKAKANADTAAAKKTEDGAQVKTVSTKKPCCAKGAKSSLVSKKRCGWKGAKTVAGKAGCSGNCPKGCTKCSSKTGTAKLVGSKPTCRQSYRAGQIETILASFPKMTYKVGDLETCCFKSASDKAASIGGKMTFLVDSKSYETRGKAKVALAGLITEKANEMASVQFVAGDKCYKCPATAAKIAKDAKAKVKYRLAGFDFDDQDKAGKVATKAQEAISGIKMTYMSEGKPVTCLKSCKAAGKKVTYVVGDQETQCEQSAKLMLAEFIARTIVEVVVDSRS